MQIRLGGLKSSEEIVPINARLSADRAKGRALQRPVIRDGRRRSCSVGVEPNEGNVFAFSDQLETQNRQRPKHPLFGCVDWELAQPGNSGQHRFSKEGLKHGCFGFKGFDAERIDMESDRGFDVQERFLEGIPLPDNNTLHAKRISHVTIGVLLNDDLDRAHVTGL